MRFKPYPQPPTHHKETGLFLNYRDYPDVNGKRFKFFDRQSIQCQMRLYRYCRSIEFSRCWIVDDMMEYLFFAMRPKPMKVVGHIMTNIIRYQPSKPKMVNGTVRRVHVIRFQEEMQYGLEWMMGAWLKLFLGGDVTPEMITEEFNAIAEMSDQEMLEYLSDVVESGVERKEPDWKKILITFADQVDQWPTTFEDRQLFLDVITRAERDVFVIPEKPYQF